MKSNRKFTHVTDTRAHTEHLYINNRRQQFPRPVILKPGDDHIGRNM
jgi:hypothetical protein